MKALGWEEARRNAFRGGEKRDDFCQLEKLQRSERRGPAEHHQTC